MRAAWLFVLAGCDLVFPLAGPPLDGRDDDIDAKPGGPACTAKFGAPEPIDTILLGAPREEEPATFDGFAELWFVIEPEDNAELFVMRDDGAGFSDPVPAGFNSAADDEDPTLTDDGLVMLYRRGGALLQLERARVQDALAFAFDTGLFGFDGVDVTGDGLRVYLSQNGRLATASRKTLEETFGAVEDLGVFGSDPTISADELEIYYEGSSGILRRTRPSRDMPFGPEESPLEGSQLPLEGNEPDLSSNGEILLFSADEALWRVTRDCP